MDEGFNVKSESYYKDIVSVSFCPKKERTDLKPKYKKGDLIKKGGKFFNRRAKYADEDLYEYLYYCWEGKKLYTAKELAFLLSLFYNKETKELYKPASIKIEFVKRNSIEKEFETNQEAILYFNELKDKCKKCGNNLL